MAEPIVGRILDWQDPVHGSLELSDIENFQKSDGDSATTLYNVNQKAIGASRSKGNTTLALTQRATVENAAKPAWGVLKALGTRCLLTATEVGSNQNLGARTAYSVQVSKVDDGTNNQGEATREVELTVIEEKQQ